MFLTSGSYGTAGCVLVCCSGSNRGYAVGKEVEVLNNKVAHPHRGACFTPISFSVAVVKLSARRSPCRNRKRPSSSIFRWPHCSVSNPSNRGRLRPSDRSGLPSSLQCRQ